MRGELGEERVDALLTANQKYEVELSRQRGRVDELKEILDVMEGPKAEDLRSVADHLLRRSVWIVGGDGWAYDIGSAGRRSCPGVRSRREHPGARHRGVLQHRRPGVQVDPMGAVAKFAAAGKETNKKDLAMQAIAYGNVYVARVAMGADPQQTLKAFREAEMYDGPSLILAYSHCIAHGIDMRRPPSSTAPSTPGR